MAVLAEQKAAVGERRAGRDRLLVRLGLALLVVIFLFDLAVATIRWPTAKGIENEAIATSIAGGHGFSFRADERWLFPESEPLSGPQSHFPTAWQEPGPAYALALAFRLLGEPGRFAFLVLNALALAGTLVAAYHIGRRLGGVLVGLAGAGFLALLPMTHETTTGWLGNTNLGMLGLTLCALTTLWTLDRPTPSRAIVLGLVVGVSAMMHAAALVFLPAAVLVLLALASVGWRQRAGAAVLMTVAAALVLTPWTVRNHQAFGEFVLVRNGTGVMAFFGNRIVADMFAGERLVPGPRPAPPPAYDGAAEAWADTVRRAGLGNLELMTPSAAWLASVTPDYAPLSEAQRDKLYMRHAIGFMLANPGLAAELAVLKLRTFLFPHQRRSHLAFSVTAVLGMIAVLLGWRDRRVWAVAILVAAYTALFTITAPLWPRYRLGIEPVIAVLAGYALVRLGGLAAGWAGLAGSRGSAVKP